MSTLTFRRSARLNAPRMPGGEVHLEPPPELPRPVAGNILMKLLPVVMIVAMLGMVAFMFTAMRDSGGGLRSPLFLMMPLMMMLSMAAMFAGGGRGGGGQKKSEMNEDRKDYLRYLGQMRERARTTMSEQRTALEWTHPDPRTLLSLPGSKRMWERRLADSDFLQIRVGRGGQRLATRLIPPQTGPVDELEPISVLALRRFTRANSMVRDLPMPVNFRGFAALSVGGEREHARAFVRALLAQIVTLHSPEDVIVAVASAGRVRAQWEWIKWLPHAQHSAMIDGIGQVRLLAPTLAQIEEWLEEELAYRTGFARGARYTDGPHIVILCEEADLTREERIVLEDGLAGVTLVDLSGQFAGLAAREGARLVAEQEQLYSRRAEATEHLGAIDSLTLAEAESLARRLAPYRVSTAASDEEDEDSPLAHNPPFLELLGIPGDPMTFDIGQAWRPRPLRERYSVPFGIGEDGQPVSLDIKEAALGGMGPHGLCVGATGSGKSEFLRTLVLGMMATHSSTTLNFVLVDFKGGATFLGLDQAPHTSAVITNLADEVTLVDRMNDALAGEMNRRQEALKNGGNFKNAWDYQRARENGADLDPMPALFIVVDEFSELLTAKPDFAELFTAIGRLGRSLQMHMLLASQRLEEGRLRGLDSHLSYRIGLKTFSAGESRNALGVPDAFELPSRPGAGYLKFDSESMTRFQAAYVSGPYRPAGIKLTGPSATAVRADKRPQPFVPDYIEPPEPPSAEDGDVEDAEDADAGDGQEEGAAQEGTQQEGTEATEPSELDVIVSRLIGQGPPAHEVWLPPLHEPNSLDTLLPGLTPTVERGLAPAEYFAGGRLRVPIGIVDRPYEQRRDLLWADVSGGAGHVAIAGGPQSGKSTMVRTLLMATALTHTPAEVQFFGIDLGGGSLASLAGLPHTGGIAVARRQPEKARRIVAEMTMLKNEREGRFGAMGIDSIGQFRNLKRQGRIPHEQDSFGDVFLVVDGWRALRDESEKLEEEVMQLSQQGLAFGIHVVVTSNRWGDFRPGIKDMLGTRFELRIGDASDSELAKKDAENVPPDRPGRGMTHGGLHFLVGLPRIDGSSDVETLGDGVADAVAQIADAWQGPASPAVRLLPEMIDYKDVASAVPAESKLVPIGINEAELAPMALNFAAEPHFIAFGDGESGKTNLLRQIVHGIAERYTVEQALVVLADFRRSMLGFLEGDQLLGYAASVNQLETLVGDVSISMERRLPGPDVTQEQLKSRSWWTGPEVFVVVDDYDLVVTQSKNPLQPLAPYLAQAKDVGLHMVIARRAGGAGRSMFDPVLGKLKEISVPGLVMNGSKDEGNLLGDVKPSDMPPGRGTFVSRKAGTQLMQVSWLDPE